MKRPFPWTGGLRGEVACLVRKAGFPGVGRCEDARGAGAGIGQSHSQSLNDRPAYDLQPGSHLPPTFCPTYLQGSRFRHPSLPFSRGRPRSLEWRGSSLDLQQQVRRGGGVAKRAAYHEYPGHHLPVSELPLCVHSLFTTCAQYRTPW